MSGFSLSAPDELVADAVISGDGAYRYTLARTWEPNVERLGFVMLNPSTADAMVDDPTIRRCMGFARRQGFGGIRVVNLFAYRATKPADLLAAHAAGVDVTGGAAADEWIARMNNDKPIVFAWGAVLARTRWHEQRVDEIVRTLDRPRIFALGTTKDGHPRHPLYLGNDAPLTPWGEKWIVTDGGLMGGTVCAVCGIPTESEPCPEHGMPRAEPEGIG
jgi:hypothetical protein